MSLLKRLSITLFSRLDGVVNDIENHDAIVEAAIEEQGKKIAGAKYQLLQLTRKRDTASSKIAQLIDQQQLWHQRALASAKSDEQKALTCLQRRREIQLRIDRTALSEQEYTKACELLERDIQNSSLELDDFNQKRDLLKAKQSSTDVLQSVDRKSCSNTKDLEKTFARWEANLCEKHSYLTSLVDSDGPIDQLENDYLMDENLQSLQAELAELVIAQPTKQGEDHE